MGGRFRGVDGSNCQHTSILYPTLWRSLRADQNKVPRILYRAKFSRGSIAPLHSMIRDRQPFENHRQSGRSEPDRGSEYLLLHRTGPAGPGGAEEIRINTSGWTLVHLKNGVGRYQNLYSIDRARLSHDESASLVPKRDVCFSK